MSLLLLFRGPPFVNPIVFGPGGLGPHKKKQPPTNHVRVESAAPALLVMATVPDDDEEVVFTVLCMLAEGLFDV